MNKDKQMFNDLIEIFDEEYAKRNLITPQNTAEKMTDKGYRKASDVAREIFEEIEKLMNEVYSSVQYGCYSYGMTKHTDSPSAQRQCGKLEGVKYLGDRIAEIKKKYTEEGK